MASINIDGSLIQKDSILQKEEKLVQFQNGCICCTLRGDLLQEVSRLAKTGQFDYLVIESTGISEPMQVAETFAMTPEDLASMGDATDPDVALTSLVGVARLDTCVTVIDVTSLLSYFQDTHFLLDSFEGVEPNDDRTVVDLLVDQIEFANVILINKMDMASSKDVNGCKALIKKLNPNATVIESSYSKIDLSQILNTNKFDLDTAQLSPGWLMSLKETHVPETEEYGISSFVYRSRRPFHPDRLFKLLVKYFIIIESPEGPAVGVPGEEDREDADQEDNKEDNQEADQEDDQEDDPWEDDPDTEMEMDTWHIEPVDEKEAQKRVKARSKSAFKNVFRSKGFLWIATRPKSMGEWSQAGMMLTIGNGGNWFSEQPEEVWPDDDLARKAIRKDFDDEVGDKRQEIVLIGQLNAKDRERIQTLLDRCLVTQKEWIQVQKSNFQDWEDPWEDWEFVDF